MSHSTGFIYLRIQSLNNFLFFSYRTRFSARPLPTWPNHGTRFNVQAYSSTPRRRRSSGTRRTCPKMRRWRAYLFHATVSWSNRPSSATRLPTARWSTLFARFLAWLVFQLYAIFFNPSMNWCNRSADLKRPWLAKIDTESEPNIQDYSLSRFNAILTDAYSKLSQISLVNPTKDGFIGQWQRQLAVVEAEAMGYAQANIKTLIAVMAQGKEHQRSLDLVFHDAPVKLRLVKGAGPVHLVGAHGVGTLALPLCFPMNPSAGSDPFFSSIFMNVSWERDFYFV